jgi:hypothetical protein
MWTGCLSDVLAQSEDGVMKKAICQSLAIILFGHLAVAFAQELAAEIWDWDKAELKQSSFHSWL